MAVLYKKPDDTDGYFQLMNDGQTEIWMDIDTWLNPIPIYSDESIEALTPELREFILRWREKAQKAKESFVPSCPEKYAGTQFVYQDKFYKISGMPGIEAELYASLSLDIERELKQLGCGWTAYTGSVD
ncbi:MAG: hypothetical protein K2J95_06005 [Lachnospiraceae bacterium]|nr:hypothetical protein [Lachnospiraceae bacterium]MDE6743413.1 hypothetical protein [Lachnospiraceae bacterium]